jgi:hypothetical protein
MFAVNKHNDLRTQVFWDVWCPDFSGDSGILQGIIACTELHGDIYKNRFTAPQSVQDIKHLPCHIWLLLSETFHSLKII